MWQVCLPIRAPRPFALAEKRRRSRGFLNIDRSHTEFVNVCTVVVFGIGNSRIESFADDAGSFLLREGGGREECSGPCQRAYRGQDPQPNGLSEPRGELHVRLLWFPLLLPLSWSSLLISCVAFESTGQCKFTQLMANHVFIDKNRHMLTSVVDGNC